MMTYVCICGALVVLSLVVMAVTPREKGASNG